MHSATGSFLRNPIKTSYFDIENNVARFDVEWHHLYSHILAAPFDTLSRSIDHPLNSHQALL